LTICLFDYLWGANAGGEKGGLGGIPLNGSLMTCPEMHGELPIFKARYSGLVAQKLLSNHPEKGKKNGFNLECHRIKLFVYN